MSSKSKRTIRSVLYQYVTARSRGGYGNSTVTYIRRTKIS